MKRILLITLGIIFIITGIFNFVEGSIASIVMIAIGLLLARGGIKFKNINTWSSPSHQSVETIVVGLDYQQRRRILENIVKETIHNNNIPPYRGLENNTIKTELVNEEKIYQFTPLSIKNVKIEEETGKGSHSNMLKVIINHETLNHTHIGYIPQEHIIRVKQIIRGQKSYPVQGEIIGGKYKILDDKSNIIKDQDPYQLKVYI